VKYVGADIINLLGQIGVSDIGENRVQDAEIKIRAVNKKFCWHMVGTLQTNKVKKALAIFDVLHALDRINLAEELQKRLAGQNKTLDTFVQVNVARELSKHGFDPAEVEEFVNMAKQNFPNINIVGLMTICPLVSNPEQVRPYFRKLRELSQRLGLSHLSMGMTQDYIVAVEEGADFLRIGMALFEGIL
jgi:hypothetical protein